MADAVIYLYAPVKHGRKWTRALKIERIYNHIDGGSYTPGEVIYEGLIPSPKDAPDRCLVFEARVVFDG